MSKKIGRPARVVQSLVQRIRKDCVAGRGPGARLPTEEALAVRYGVNAKTVRSALRELERRSEVTRKPSGGAFVAERPDEMWESYIGKAIAVGFRDPYAWRDDPFIGRLFGGIAQRLVATGINLTFSSRNWLTWKGPDKPADHFRSPDIVGLIVVGLQREGVLDSLRSLSLPKVAIDFDATEKGIDSFCLDNVGVGELLARRLLKLGHRQVAAIFEDPARPVEATDPAWSDREAGFRSVLNNAPDATLHPLLVRERGRFESALRHLDELLGRPPDQRPTAVFLPHDLLAEVKTIASDRGIRIPRGLSVVGVDNSDGRTEMTAVGFDAHALGMAATFHLLKRIRDPRWSTRKPALVKVKGQYVARRSHARAQV